MGNNYNSKTELHSKLGDIVIEYIKANRDILGMFIHIQFQKPGTCMVFGFKY